MLEDIIFLEFQRWIISGKGLRERTDLNVRPGTKQIEDLDAIVGQGRAVEGGR